eukprot:g14096.t1
MAEHDLGRGQKEVMHLAGAMGNFVCEGTANLIRRGKRRCEVKAGGAADEDRAADDTGLDQNGGPQDDDAQFDDEEQHVPDGNSSSNSLSNATAEAAAVTAPTVGDIDAGNDEGQQEAVLRRPETKSSAPESSAQKTEAAPTDEGGAAEKAAGEQQEPVTSSEDADSGAAPATARNDGEAQQTAAEAEWKRRELRVHKAFFAMLGERSYDEKRQTLDYLADPTSRPDNPRLPAVPAERKQAVALAGLSVESWPRDVLMNVDYEGLVADLVDERIRAQKVADLADERIRARNEWRSAPSAEWMRLVPSMKRRAEQPAVRGRGRGDPSPRRCEGSAFHLFRRVSEGPGEGVGAANKRPRLGTTPGYDGYDDDALIPTVVRRLDEQDNDSAIDTNHFPAPGMSPSGTFSPGTAQPNSLARVPGRATRTPKPAGAEGAARAAALARRRSSGVALTLRYRSSSRLRDCTPSVHKRQTLVGFGAGTLGDFLGETGTGGNRPGRNPGLGATVANGTPRDDSDRLGSSPEVSKRREEGQEPVNSGERDRAGGNGSPAAGSKRAATSSLGLGLSGMNATPRKRVLEEVVAREGEQLARKVAEEAEAAAFVGNILTEAVSRENKTRYVGRQVREEQALRAKNNYQQQPQGRVDTNQGTAERGSHTHNQQQQQQQQRQQQKARSETASVTFTSTSTPNAVLLAVPQPAASPFAFPPPSSCAPTRSPSSAQTRSSEFDFKAAVESSRLPQEGDDAANGGGNLVALANTSTSTSSSDADFTVGTSSRRGPSRCPAADPASFRFSEVLPVKQYKDAAFGRGKDSGTLALTSDRGDDDIAVRADPGAFEFSTEPRKARKTRRGAATGKSSAKQAAMAPLAVAPLAVAGEGKSKPSGGTTAAAPLVTNGLDMSMFKKPGEWKCEACLVRNDTGTTKCVSCESSKLGEGVESGSAGSGGILVGAPAPATSPSTFGVQPSPSPAAGGRESSLAAAVSGSSASTGTFTTSATLSFRATATSGAAAGAAAVAAAAAAPSPARAPAAGGLDMSMFRKPGEWKCEACLVRNDTGTTKCASCETPKPGAGGESASAGSGGVVGGASACSTPSFTFGVQPAASTTTAGAAGGSTATSSSAFTFGGGVQASTAAPASTTTAAFTFGAPVGSSAGGSSGGTVAPKGDADASPVSATPASVPAGGELDMINPGTESAPPSFGSAFGAATVSAPTPKISFGVHPSGGASGRNGRSFPVRDLRVRR